jgi:uncharacterized repeat protein (TIGR01451 family)
MSDLTVTLGTVTFSTPLELSQLSFSRGTLGSSETITVSGAMNWSGGTHSGTGTTVIESGATLSIPPSPISISPFLSERSLINDGTITWTGGNWATGAGVTVTNNGLFQIQTDGVLSGGSLSSFNNLGSIVKSGSTGTTNIGGGFSTFNNSGVVDIQAGTFLIFRNGTDADGGSYLVGGGTTLDFRGSRTIEATHSITGAGTVLFSGGNTTFDATYEMSDLTVTGGSVHFSTPVDVSQLSLSGGALGGSSTVTVSGTMDWTAGFMLGTGSTILTAGSTGTISGGVGKQIRERRLENSGTLTWTGTALLRTSVGAVIVNTPTGLFDIQTDAAFDYCCGGGAKGTFNNAGTLRKSVATGTTAIDQVFNNIGTVASESGVLSFEDGYLQLAGLTALAGGGLATSTTLDIQGGALGGTGTIIGNVSNAAQLIPGTSPGILSITGDYTQGPDGVLAIELGGTTAGTTHDQLQVGGAATLDGTLDVSLLGGFDPVDGDSLEILTFSSVSGDFATKNGLTLPDGDVLEPVYSATALTLVNQEPTAASADLSIVKSAPEQVAPGELFEYMLHVQNLGPATAFAIDVEDVLPPEVSFVSASGPNSTCSHVNATVTCQIFSLAFGGSETITLTVVPEITIDEITNVATVRWDGDDPVASNDSSSATTVIRACPGPVELLSPPSEATDVEIEGLLTWAGDPEAEIYSVYLSLPTRIGCGALIGTTTGTSFEYAALEHDTRYVWRVEAGKSGCSAASSACFRFRTAAEPSPDPDPEPDPCENLVATVVAVPGEINSGERFRALWAAVEGAEIYELQESLGRAFNDPTVLMTALTATALVREAELPRPLFYRVRAFCGEVAGPWSPASRIVIVPLPTSSLETTIVKDFGFADPVETTIHVPFPEELAPPGTPVAFQASADQPWLTVLPSAGMTPPEGLDLTLRIDPSELPVGSSQTTISILFEILSGAKSASSSSSSSSVSVTVTLVTPVTPTAKDSPPDDALIIPGVAHVPGFQSQWQSDIRVANVTSTGARYRISFTASGEDGTQSGKQSEIQIGPQTTVAINDIVRRWYGLGSLGDGTSGVLEIRRLGIEAPPPGGGFKAMPTVASSRTYNITTEGTIGQFVPAIPFSRFLGRDPAAGPTGSLTMLHVAQSARFRTNLGLVEGSGAAATVALSVRSATGTLVDEFEIELLPAEHRQLNSVLAQRGIALSAGRIDARVTGGSGRITSYASVIDNLSNDPMLVPGTPVASAMADRWVVAGVADFATERNRWRSDLRILNPADAAATVELTFIPQGAPDETSSIVIEIGPGEIAMLDDVLRESFGLTNRGGAIHVTSASQRSLVVSGRTYDERGEEGSFGQFLQGLTREESFGVEDRALQILQVEDSPQFRANLGIAEVTGEAATVEISVIAPGARAVPTARIDLQPFEFTQLVSIGKRFGISNLYNGRVTVRVVSGQGRIIAYGSVIDESTQDPSYVPSQ